MANTLKSDKSNVINGLGTYTYAVMENGMHSASMLCYKDISSHINLSISQSGSRTDSNSHVSSSTAQPAVSLKKVFNCSIGDVITFVISSTAAKHADTNTLKTVISIHPGIN